MSKKTLILKIVAIDCACVLLLLLTAVLLNRENPIGQTQPAGNTETLEVTNSAGEVIDPTTGAEDSPGVGEGPGLEGEAPLVDDPVEDPMGMTPTMKKRLLEIRMRPKPLFKQQNPQEAQNPLEPPNLRSPSPRILLLARKRTPRTTRRCPLPR